LTWGANAIYDIVGGKLVFSSFFKIPAPQVEQENCVAHNGSIVPVPGRDIFVQAWYQGGISVIDFTDSANPIEIAYFDRGPIDEKDLLTAGFWSAYWYNGKIYGTEILRGLDIFTLKPSEHLSENELAAAALADQGRVFNPQQQFPVTWPAEPVVALAYLDQLRRAKALPDTFLDVISAALDEVKVLKKGSHDKNLAGRLERFAKSLEEDETVSHAQAGALSKTLADIAAGLRS